MAVRLFVERISRRRRVVRSGSKTEDVRVEVSAMFTQCPAVVS